LHVVASARAGLEQVPVVGSQEPAAWHWSAAEQTTGLAPTQAPPWQVSVRGPACRALQEVALAEAGLEQVPVGGLQLPAAWHWSEAEQTTGLAPTQAPPWQVSVRVQTVPSLQAVPLALAGLEQVPVMGLQLPAAWHWSEAAQTTGSEPTQAPPWQV